jgi:hypothetical protein
LELFNYNKKKVIYRAPHYICKPENDLYFRSGYSDLLYKAYDAGNKENAGYNARESFQKVIARLHREIEMLEAANLGLIQQLQYKTKYSETVEQPQLREAYKTLKRKKSYNEYYKYFGSALVGTGIMGIGIYTYSYFYNLIFSFIYFSASNAAMQPAPAEVTACR